MHERKSSRYRKRVKRKVYFSQIKYLQHIDICGKKKKRSEEMERRKKQEMMKIKYLKRREGTKGQIEMEGESGRKRGKTEVLKMK